MKAVFVSAGEENVFCEMRDIPIPEPGDDEVLIKNVVVASNPKDWKLPMIIPGYNDVEGNDVAGHIHSIGKSVTRFAKGDKVAGFSKMKTATKYGAYQEYTVVPENCIFGLSEEASYEEASTFPLAYMTAAVGLFIRLGLPAPGERKEEAKKTAVLVYGGATTVGVFAIQLAKHAGLHVVAVAGSSIDIAKQMGADEVIDYRGKTDAQLSTAIAEAASSYGGIHHAFNTVAEKGTPLLIASALEKNGGGKYTNVLLVTKDDEAAFPSSVGLMGWTQVADAYGSQKEFAEKWYTQLGEWFAKGEFKPHHVRVIEGGLDGVPEGLRMLKAGEVRGQKLVYRISETKGI